MGGGGGKGGGGQQVAPTAPQYVDPVTGKQFQTPQELNSDIEARKASELATSQRKEQEAAAKKASDLAAWQGKANTAREVAERDIQRTFETRGLNPSLYASDIASRIQRASAGIQEMDPNPAGYYSPTMGSDLINELTTGQQTRYLGDYDKTFTPNYSMNAFSDDILDPNVNSILENQFNPITTQLENAKKRGQLTESGYAGAQKEFTNRQTAARGQVSDLAKNILNADRSLLDSYIGSGRNRAGSTALGQNFDVGQYQTGANEIVNRERGSFGSELASAVGDARYVDLQDLMNAGGAAQGPTGGGIGVQSPIDPALIAANINEKNRRGLGTQGEF